MPTLREAQELQALAQIALPAMRRGRFLDEALPCRADRYRLRAAVLRLLRGVPLSIDARLAAVEHLAGGGDPWP